MKKLILSMLILLLTCSPVFGAKLTQKQLQFVNEWGDPVNMGTDVSLYIYNVGTTTEKSIYLDKGGANAVTQPVTDDSTNTPLSYTEGIMTFWCGTADYKITVTDGTYTRTLDNLTGSDTRLMWPTFLVALSSYSLGQSEDLDFTYGAWVMDGDVAGRLDLIPDAADGVFAIGNSSGTTQGDVYVYASSTEYLYFDQSGAELNLTHIDLIVDDSSTLYFGDGKDVGIKFDNSNDDLDITGDGSELAVGASGAGLDVYIHGQTGNFVFFDEDNDRTFFEDWDLRINEGGLIEFADVNDAVDWTIKCATSERLEFLPTETTDDQAFYIGDAAHTADFKIYSKTSGETFTWDAGADSLTVVGDLSLFTMTGTTVPFRVDATGTVAAGNAIELETTSGPIQILADGSSTGDITIDAEDTITLVSTDNGVGGIYLHLNGGTSETLKIHSDKGTSVTEGAESVTILSDAGGVGIRSTANLANAVNITADSGTTTSISIYNDTGSSTTEGSESISILSDAGGVGIRSTANLANAVNITADGDTATTMTLYNDTGTSTTEGAASIQLLSDVGSIELKSGLNAADAINIMVDSDTSGGITIFNDTGTGDESIVLLSDLGGITVHASAGSVDIEAVGASDGDLTLSAGDDFGLTITGTGTITIGEYLVITDDDLFAFGTGHDVTFNYDEDGDDNLQVKGPVNFETSFCEFRSNPVVCKNDGTAIAGATGETDFMAIDGINFEYFILGAGQTIALPFIDTYGLNVRLDQADNEGLEMGEGITSRSKSAFTIGTDAFYLKVKFYIEDVNQLDICAMGFRKTEAYNADLYAYNTYAGINVNNGAVNGIDELNGADAHETDMEEDWLDGATHTLELRISAAKAVTQYFDGSAVTTPLAFTWTDTDTVVPFFTVLGDATAASDVSLVYWECGLQ